MKKENKTEGHYPEDCYLHDDCGVGSPVEGKSQCCNSTISHNGICSACGKFAEIIIKKN